MHKKYFFKNFVAIRIIKKSKYGKSFNNKNYKSYYYVKVIKK
jgi:hypothetical protein